MGTGITFCVEKITEGKWEYVEAPVSFESWNTFRQFPNTSFYDSQDYELFSFLADVRGNFTFAGGTVSRLPKDVSTHTKFRLLSVDHHTFAVYSAEDLLFALDTVTDWEYVLVEASEYNHMIQGEKRKPAWYLMHDTDILGDYEIIWSYPDRMCFPLKSGQSVFINTMFRIKAKEKFPLFVDAINNALTICKCPTENIRFLMAFDG